MKNVQPAFQEYVIPLLPSFVKIRFTAAEIDKAKRFAIDKAATKVSSGENCHKVDGNNEFKRNLTGVLGELAVEKFLGIEFIDWSVGSDSKKFNVPDVGVEGLGVKTVEYGKMPIIHKWSKYPEIICILNPDYSVSIAGIASANVLNKYQSDELVLSPLLRKRDVKSGFYGFNFLQPIDTLKRGA